MPCPAAELRMLPDVGGQVAPVVPHAVAGRRVERFDVIVARMGDVEDAVIDERPNLLRSLIHRIHPGEAQLRDVVAGDLIERAERLEVVGAVYHQPVRRVGVAQHRVGDRDEIRRLFGGRRGGHDGE